MGIQQEEIEIDLRKIVEAFTDMLNNIPEDFTVVEAMMTLACGLLVVSREATQLPEPTLPELAGQAAELISQVALMIMPNGEDIQ